MFVILVLSIYIFLWTCVAFMYWYIMPTGSIFS